MHRIAKSVIIAGTAAAVLTGCGTPAVPGGAPDADDEATAVYDEINALSGQERTDRLVELAEEEGALTIYTSNTDMDAIVEGFKSEYDIEVESTRGNSETVLQKLLTEGNSGSLDVDFVDNNAAELNIMAEQGFFADYQSDYRDAVREEGQMDGWTSHYFNAFVVGWNTDNVDGTELPDEIKDFADPKWKGRITLELGDVDWYAAVTKYYLARGMSEDDVEEMWQAIAANATVEKGHSAMGDMLSAGKLEIALSIYQHTVDGAADEDGAPVVWKDGSDYVKPVVVRPNGAGIMSTAKHPAAAMLFMDYVLTEGQQTIADVHRVPSVDGFDSPIDGVETIALDDEILSPGGLASWDERYRQLVGG